MGACASAPAAVEGPGDDAPAARAGGAGAGAGAKAPRDRQHDRLGADEEAQLQLDMLRQVSDLQQHLVEVSACPLLGLQEAADRMLESLQVDLVGIWVIPKADPSAAVLMAAQGAGVSVLQRGIVVQREPAALGSCLRAGAPVAMCVPDASLPKAPSIEPADLWRGPAGLRSFVQAPIGPADAPLGVLLLAKAEPGAFEGAGWQVQLQLASTGLMAQLRHAQVERMAQLLRRLDGIEDPVAMIAALLKGAADFMLKSCTLRTTPRIALLTPAGAGDASFASQTGGAGGEEALLFELAAGRASMQDGGIRNSSYSFSAGNTISASSEDDEDVAASRLKLHNTLLGAAIAQSQARFVSDVGTYMQSSVRPARDIFTRASLLVSSVVVMPLLAAGQAPLGGLYFALDAPCEFSNIQDTLLGFISGVVPLLYSKLAGKSEALSATARAAQRRAPNNGSFTAGTRQASFTGAARYGSFTGAARRGPSTAGAAAAVAEAPSAGDVAAPSTFSSSSNSDANQQAAVPAGMTPSGRLPAISSSDRLNTEAMLTLLQQDIRSKTRSRRGEALAAEVATAEIIGESGGCAVYRGWWHRVQVAVKVMPVRASEREAMQDAVEMAVLSSVQHPNIVTVYACLTDLVEVADCAGSRSTMSRSLELRTYYRRLTPDEDPDSVDTFNVIVMEPCDRGNLRDALGSGLLHQMLPSGAVGVQVGPLLELLGDVAHALQYLHGMQLVHGNVTLDNVLLKADRTRHLGVTPKLAHFGTTYILSDGEQSAERGAPAAGAAYLAPELLSPGGQVTTAADSFAFGVMMYESYMGKRAYSGVPAAEVAARVRDQGLRPRFHSSAPRSYVELARACWAADPASRPGAAQIAARLEDIAAELAGPA